MLQLQVEAGMVMSQWLASQAARWPRSGGSLTPMSTSPARTRSPAAGGGSSRCWAQRTRTASSLLVQSKSSFDGTEMMEVDQLKEVTFWIVQSTGGHRGGGYGGGGTWNTFTFFVMFQSKEDRWQRWLSTSTKASGVLSRATHSFLYFFCRNYIWVMSLHHFLPFPIKSISRSNTCRCTSRAEYWE